MLMSAYQTMPVIAVRERINGITLSVIDKATHLLSLTATSSWLITFTGLSLIENFAAKMYLLSITHLLVPLHRVTIVQYIECIEIRGFGQQGNLGRYEVLLYFRHIICKIYRSSLTAPYTST